MNSINVMRGAPRPLYIYYTFFIAVPFMVSFPQKNEQRKKSRKKRKKKKIVVPPTIGSVIIGGHELNSKNKRRNRFWRLPPSLTS